MIIDLANFYLSRLMKDYEYLHIKLIDIPNTIIDEYYFYVIKSNGYVYVEIRYKAYNLPQARVLIHNQLSQ